MAPMAAPRRLHVHFCDAGEATEVLVPSGQDIRSTVSQKIGVPAHEIALELLDGEVAYDPALYATCSDIRAVRRCGGAARRGEGSAGSQQQQQPTVLFNFPSAKILLTTEGIFSQETAVYELLDNALESVYLRRRASGTPSSYIPQVVLLLDLERNILRVVDNGRSLTYGELVMWGQLGTSDHQKHGDSASGFFPVRYSRFGVGSKGAGKALLGEGGELSMARVEGGSGTKLTMPIAKMMAAAEEGDRKGEWKQPVSSWQPDAQVRALMGREGWGDKATCFEVLGVKGNTLAVVEAMLTQQGGLVDKLCDKYLPCLVTTDPSSAARALPEMEGLARQPIRMSIELGARRIKLNDEIFGNGEVDNLRCSQIILARQIRDQHLEELFPQAAGSHSAATRAADPSCPSMTKVFDSICEAGGKRGSWRLVLEYFPSINGSKSMPPIVEPGCFEVRWNGRLLSEERTKSFQFTEPAGAKELLGRGFPKNLPEAVWQCFTGTLYLDGNFAVDPTKNALLHDSSVDSLVQNLFRKWDSRAEKQRGHGSARSSPLSSPGFGSPGYGPGGGNSPREVASMRQQQQLDAAQKKKEEMVPLAKEMCAWLHECRTNVDEDVIFVAEGTDLTLRDVDATRGTFKATTNHVRISGKDLVAPFRDEESLEAKDPDPKKRLLVKIAVRKQEEFAEVCDFQFDGSYDPASALRDSDVTEACRQATSGFVRLWRWTHARVTERPESFPLTSLRKKVAEGDWKRHITAAKKHLPSELRVKSDAVSTSSHPVIDVGKPIAFEDAASAKGPGHFVVQVFNGQQPKEAMLGGLPNRGKLTLEVNGQEVGEITQPSAGGEYWFACPHAHNRGGASLKAGRNICIFRGARDGERDLVLKFDVTVLPAERPERLFLDQGSLDENGDVRLGDTLPRLCLEALDATGQRFDLDPRHVSVHLKVGGGAELELHYRKPPLRDGRVAFDDLQLRGKLNLSSSGRSNVRPATLVFRYEQPRPQSQQQLELEMPVQVSSGPVARLDLDAEQTPLEPGKPLPALELRAFDAWDNPATGETVQLSVAPEGSLQLKVSEVETDSKGKAKLKARWAVVSSAPAVGNATVTFSSAGVSKALAVPIVEPPAARVELVCPDSVGSGESFELELVAYSEGGAEVAVPEIDLGALRLAVGGSGIQAQVDEWQHDGQRLRSTCTAVGKVGTFTLTLQLNDANAIISTKELELCAGAAAGISASGKEVLNGSEIVIDAWVVDSHGNKLETGVFAWQFAASTPGELEVVYRAPARAPKAPSASLKARVCTKRVLPQSTPHAVTIRATPADGGATLQKEVQLQLRPAELPSRIALYRRSDEDVLPVVGGIQVVAGELPELLVSLLLENGEEHERVQQCQLEVSWQGESYKRHGPFQNDSHSAFLVSGLPASTTAGVHKLKLTLHNFKAAHATADEQRKLGAMLEASGRTETVEEIDVTVLPAAPLGLQLVGDEVLSLQGSASRSNVDLRLVDAHGNVIDETFDVTVTLTPPATPPPTDTESTTAVTESTTAVLRRPPPNSTLKVKRGKLKLSALQLSNGRSGEYSLDFTKADGSLAGSVPIAYTDPAEEQADAERLRQEIAQLQTGLDEKKRLRGEATTRRDAAKRALEDAQGELRETETEENARKKQRVLMSRGTAQAKLAETQPPEEAQISEDARRLGTLLGAMEEEPTVQLLLDDDEGVRRYTRDQVDGHVLQDEGGAVLRVSELEDEPGKWGIFKVARTRHGSETRERRGDAVFDYTTEAYKMKRAVVAGASVCAAATTRDARVAAALPALIGGDTVALHSNATFGAMMPLLRGYGVGVRRAPANFVEEKNYKVSVDGSTGLLEFDGEVLPPGAKEYGAAYLVNLVVLPDGAQGAALRRALWRAVGRTVVVDGDADRMIEYADEFPHLHDVVALGAHGETAPFDAIRSSGVQPLARTAGVMLGPPSDPQAAQALCGTAAGAVVYETKLVTDYQQRVEKLQREVKNKQKEHDAAEAARRKHVQAVEAATAALTRKRKAPGGGGAGPSDLEAATGQGAARHVRHRPGATT